MELLIMDKKATHAPSATRLREEAINEIREGDMTELSAAAQVCACVRVCVLGEGWTHGPIIVTPNRWTD